MSNIVKILSRFGVRHSPRRKTDDNALQTLFIRADQLWGAMEQSIFPNYQTIFKGEILVHNGEQVYCIEPPKAIKYEVAV